MREKERGQRDRKTDSLLEYHYKKELKVYLGNEDWSKNTDSQTGQWLVAAAILYDNFFHSFMAFKSRSGKMRNFSLVN